MQPDGGRRPLGSVTEALSQSLPIASIAQAAPQNHRKGERRSTADQPGIDDAHQAAARLPDAR